MEHRNLNISFNKSGNGSYTPRIVLPISWVKEMGISPDNRQVKVIFENNKIIIEKK